MSAVQSLLKGVKELGDMEAEFNSLSSLRQAIEETKQRLAKLHEEEARVKGSLLQMRQEGDDIQTKVNSILDNAKVQADAEVEWGRERAEAEYSVVKAVLDQKMVSAQGVADSLFNQVTEAQARLDSLTNKVHSAEGVRDAIFSKFDEITGMIKQVRS